MSSCQGCLKHLEVLSCIFGSTVLNCTSFKSSSIILSAQDSASFSSFTDSNFQLTVILFVSKQQSEVKDPCLLKFPVQLKISFKMLRVLKGSLMLLKIINSVKKCSYTLSKTKSTSWFCSCRLFANFRAENGRKNFDAINGSPALIVKQTKLSRLASFKLL